MEIKIIYRDKELKKIIHGLYMCACVRACVRVCVCVCVCVCVYMYIYFYNIIFIVPYWNECNTIKENIISRLTKKYLVSE